MDPLDLIRQGKVKRFFRATRKLTAAKVVSHPTQRAAGKKPLFTSRMTSCSCQHVGYCKIRRTDLDC
jgi:hypothetical protein